MENFANIRSNINNSMLRLKREWYSVREIWKDSKAKEYEKTYISPIELRQNGVLCDIETLEKITDKLKKLGVDI